MTHRHTVVYIAGPYRSSHGPWGIRQNILRAEDLARQVWQAGFTALCPHKNTALFDGMPGMEDQDWLDGGLELLRRCDAMILTEYWRGSEGTWREIEYAREQGIPVFESVEELKDHYA